MRGDGAEGLAPDLAVFGKGDKEIDFCACYADEEKPAFLFGLFVVIDASFVRQQALFDAYDEDIIEFETFRGMQGHKGDTFG